MIIIASSFQNPSNTIPILFLRSNKGDTSIVVRYLFGTCPVNNHTNSVRMLCFYRIHNGHNLRQIACYTMGTPCLNLAFSVAKIIIYSHLTKLFKQYHEMCIRQKKQRTCYQIRCLFYSRNAGYYTLISTSTPLGSSSFIRASTVLAVEL